MSRSTRGAIQPCIPTVAKTSTCTSITVAKHFIGAVIFTVEGTHHPGTVLPWVGPFETHGFVERQDVPWIDSVPLWVGRFPVIPGKTFFTGREGHLCRGCRVPTGDKRVAVHGHQGQQEQRRCCEHPNNGLGWHGGYFFAPSTRAENAGGFN